jgi:4-carboxymuconolactone decarboxylase
MKPKTDPTANTDSPDVKLPGTAALIATTHPELWEAYQRFGEQLTAAGPLDPRSRRLVHLALAIASGSEGATHSHARRGLDDGLTSAELEHVALLAATTVGWPQAVKGFTWVRDVTRKAGKG